MVRSLSQDTVRDAAASTNDVIDVANGQQCIQCDVSARSSDEKGVIDSASARIARSPSLAIFPRAIGFVLALAFHLIRRRVRIPLQCWLRERHSSEVETASDLRRFRRHCNTRRISGHHRAFRHRRSQTSIRSQKGRTLFVGVSPRSDSPQVGRHDCRTQ